MFKTEQLQVESGIKTIFMDHDIPLPDDLDWSPVPFAGEWGLSTSFFKVAALEAKSEKSIKVPQRAEEIAQLVAENLKDQEYFPRVEAAGGYLNLYFDSHLFSSRVVSTIFETEEFGKGIAKSETLMVEFSQPNTHKAFHVGHFRSAILGDALCRILDYAGYDVIRANYYGDIGLHVIRWLWNYLNFHRGETPPEDATRWMGDLHAEATHRLEENPELETEVRALYAKWDQQDPEIVDLWKRPANGQWLDSRICMMCWIFASTVFMPTAKWNSRVRKWLTI